MRLVTIFKMKPRKLPRSVRPEELKDLKGDSSKIRKELSWYPEYTFEEMLDEMVEYWLNYYNEKK